MTLHVTACMAIRPGMLMVCGTRALSPRWCSLSLALPHRLLTTHGQLVFFVWGASWAAAWALDAGAWAAARTLGCPPGAAARRKVRAEHTPAH